MELPPQQTGNGQGRAEQGKRSNSPAGSHLPGRPGRRLCVWAGSDDQDGTRCDLHGEISRPKDGQVMPFRNLQDDLFLLSFLAEVLGQFLAQQARVGADDVVLAGVISRRALKDVDADVLLGGFTGGIAHGAIRYIEQEVSEARRRLKGMAGGDSLYQRPLARIRVGLAALGSLKGTLHRSEFMVFHP